MLATKEKIILLAIGAFFVALAVWVVISVVVAPTSTPIDAVIPQPSDKEIKEPPAGIIIRPAPTPRDEGGGGMVACTMEAKLCPDGSAVGRTGPNCEFAPCPTTTPQPSPTPGSTSGSCTSNSDCAKGYSCIDASPVVREGTQNLRCWKDGTPTPICLSGETRIATPKGEVLVKNIMIGDTVWSIDAAGRKVAVRVLISAHTDAPKEHHVIRLLLSDGRALVASPGHPVADGRTLGSIKAGDTIEGTKVESARLERYAEPYTYDILPHSASGMYFANGILLQSTLKK